MRLSHGETDQASALPLLALVERCNRETRRFRERQAHDQRFCYELFRRAVVDSDEQAWEHIYACYLPFVLAWVRRHPAFSVGGEQPHYFANRAFERLWVSLAKKGLVRFPDLASLLRYLQLCVHSAIIDHNRAVKGDEVSLEPDSRIPTSPTPGRGTESRVLADLERSELWAHLETCFNDDLERTVFYTAFVLDWKPRQLMHRRPELFQDVQDIYRVKQNVLARLARDPKLQGFLDHD